MYAGDEVAAQIELLEVRQHLDALRAPQHVALHTTQPSRAGPAPSIASYHTQKAVAVCPLTARTFTACNSLQHESAAAEQCLT